MSIGETWIQEAWRQTTDKVTRVHERIGANFPHASQNGRYQLEPAGWWTAGFWPGLLWLVYRETKDEALRKTAQLCEEQMDGLLTDPMMVDHDLGFMWTLTSRASYQLLGDEASRRRALLAANLLAARFNAQGRYIRAWNGQLTGWAIIDCLMNLPLLYWASQETGDPRFRHIAVQHADTVLTHFIRPDGSVHHIVAFDPETGEKVEAKGGQGYAPDSAWSRGTAWAIYGLSLSYRYTGYERYLNAAKRVAHFFIANLPEDHVPWWDFRIPEDVPRYRDSSAGAIAACGLLLIAEQVSPFESAIYHEAGKRILHSLYTRYGAWDQDEEGLILHGTSHYPEQRNIDVPLIYGDYYFAEGIARLNGYTELFW